MLVTTLANCASKLSGRPRFSSKPGMPEMNRRSPTRAAKDSGGALTPGGGGKCLMEARAGVATQASICHNEVRCHRFRERKFPAMSDGPLGLTIESWKLIVSVIGSLLASAVAFLGYILARNESTWRNRQGAWEERSNFHKDNASRFEILATNERKERIEKEAQLDKLKEKIADLRDQKSEILKANLLETDAAVLKLKSDLSDEVTRLRKEVEVKDRELDALRATQTQSLRQLETLQAEVSVRNHLIDELQKEIESLAVVSVANNEIVLRLDKAALDVRSVERRRGRAYAQLSNMKTDIIRTAEKAVIAGKSAQIAQAEQRMRSEMARRNQIEASEGMLSSVKLPDPARNITKKP